MPLSVAEPRLISARPGTNQRTRSDNQQELLLLELLLLYLLLLEFPLLELLLLLLLLELLLLLPVFSFSPGLVLCCFMSFEFLALFCKSDSLRVLCLLLFEAFDMLMSIV